MGRNLTGRSGCKWRPRGICSICSSDNRPSKRCSDFFLRLTFVRCLLLGCNILNVLQNVNTGYHLQTWSVNIHTEISISVSFRLESNDMSTAEHMGTHIDAPAHLYKGAKRLDEIPLEDLNAPMVVIDVQEKVNIILYCATPKFSTNMVPLGWTNTKHQSTLLFFCTPRTVCIY